MPRLTFWRRPVTADLARCPRCSAPGAGPFVHRGRVFGVCDADRLRWLLPLDVRDVARLDAVRLGYRGTDERKAAS